MAKEYKRESGIELLRIILMLQIVFLHISEYGGYTEQAMKIGGHTKLAYLAIWLLCRCPVPLLIVLTGYFMAGHEISLKKMLGKWIPVHHTMWFYSISIMLFCLAAGALGLPFAGLKEVDTEEMIIAFLPFLHRTWFFMTNYLLVLFLTPFVNKALCRLNRQEYLILTGGLFFLLTIWTSLAGMEGINDIISLKKVVVNESGKSLYMFLFLYILGGCVRRCIPEREGIQWKWLLSFFLLWAVNLTLTWYAGWYGQLFRKSDNPIVILQCVTLLLFFRSLHFSSGFVNAVSKNNIGVYLIHEHHMMRSLVWSSFPFLKTREFYGQGIRGLLSIAVILCICICVYLVCNLLEECRLRLFHAAAAARNRKLQIHKKS
ncbi:MAG: hypothetical protein Q4F21_06260 [Lachnospiraceae bacterium]|nr:hypothetical protein [Lachnospiraceae bacterium]